MERLFAECSVRAALLFGATAIVLYCMKVKSAAARHGVWAGVAALMLLLPVWTSWGPKVSLRVLPPSAQRMIHKTVAQPDILSTSTLPSPRLLSRQTALLGLYLLGLCILLFRLAIGTVRARRLVRDAILHDGMHISSLCAVPVTVGFLYPIVILPERWRQWSPAQLDAVLTHERAHVRRRDSLIQWLALLNRALFWFHPVAWWLERHLSALAEEACDNVVLAGGHDSREYSEYLIEMARSVMRSGARLDIAGMAMPGGSLPRRIRRILEGGPVPRISSTRMAVVAVACVISCTAFASGTLDRVRQVSLAQPVSTQSGPVSASHLSTNFVLGDLKIEGDVHDRDGVRSRILNAWTGRGYDDAKELADEVAAGIRGDFQERGYFKVVVHDSVSQSLELADGKQQRVLVISTVTEGDQFRLGNLTIQNVLPDHALSIPAATLREQFHLRNGDLFNVREVHSGLERVQRLYEARGYADAREEPATAIDDAHHVINFTLRIAEGPRNK